MLFFVYTLIFSYVQGIDLSDFDVAGLTKPAFVVKSFFFLI